MTFLGLFCVVMSAVCVSVLLVLCLGLSYQLKLPSLVRRAMCP